MTFCVFFSAVLNFLTGLSLYVAIITCSFNSEFTLCNSVFVSATELKREVNCDFLSHTSGFYLAIPKKSQNCWIQTYLCINVIKYKNINVFVYIIYVCVLCIFIMYI